MNRGTLRGPTRLTGLMLAAAWVLTGGAPSAAAWEYVEAPAKVEPVAVGISIDTEGERRVIVGVSLGYCVGEKTPDIDHVRVVERPAIRGGHLKRSIITAFVHFPPTREAVGPVTAGESLPICADLGLGISTTVKLKRPKSDLTFFDGSFSPPRRIVPADFWRRGS